jgi:hypothetical protein
MPNCDWGRPCNCSDCATEIQNNKCCKCDDYSSNFTRSLITDRKGISGYITSGYCEGHYKAYMVLKEEDDKKKAGLAQQKQLEKQQHIENITSIEHKTFIPIKEAIIKFKGQRGSTCHNGNYIREHFIPAQLLLVQKIKNRWVCSKERLDGIDFKHLNY